MDVERPGDTTSDDDVSDIYVKWRGFTFLVYLTLNNNLV